MKTTRAVAAAGLAAALGLALPSGLDAAPVAAAAGPLVVGVRSHAHPDRPLQAGLGERVTLQVEGLRAGLAALTNGCAELILFIDGVPIPGTPPESCTPENGRVRFLLDRTEDSDAAWHTLLGSPDDFTRRVTLSVGPEGDEQWQTKVRDFRLELLPPVPFFLFFGLLAAALALAAWLARRTALLRDPHVVPPAGALAPYSLARFQLAYWSFLTLAAFVFIWMVTEELDTITGSVLGMLGIGSGTALGASLIAQGKETAPGAAAPAQTAPSAASQGFLRDVLDSPQGLSPYRLQMLGWTLVTGVIFCVSVYNRLAMPDFSPTLLALMGISSATYLGAKIPEE
ncbi:MAG TPA: hypothetical protein VF121_03120 [Thermoanaerobaculia bacterium]|nr:hypothetical protein [Thermoanaerobaculia bacterium]